MKYFTADLHLDHEKAMNFPGRKGFSLKDWQDLMLGDIAQKVTKSDTLFILGDFAFSPQKWREKIKCRNLWLILGNHDSEAKSVATFGRDKVRHTFCTKVCGTQTFLSHYCHNVWPASHYGSFHLYGHTHNQREKYWDGIFPERRSMDVAPECYKEIYGDFGIFSENQIYDRLIIRKGSDPVEWYRAENGPLGVGGPQ